ncbi:MAG TPA: DUF2892 domain-containing protein [Chitinophagales bacterium]|nr:DUF2892 domain-containing protein [Chitinophagales bacterium]
MGKLDKTLRIAVAAVIAILYFTHVISGTLAIVLGIVAIIFLLTSLVGNCPLYIPLKINTNKEEKQ